MPLKYFLRPAENTDKDIEAILGLIKALALYEKSPESALATPELIRSNVFEKQYANTVLAFEGDAEHEGRPLALAP